MIPVRTGVGRQGYTPLDVPGDAAVVQALFEIVGGEVTHVGTPVILLANPLGQLGIVGAETQEEVLGVPHDGRAAAQGALRANELRRVQRAAALVALVAARVVGATVGACAGDVTVRQEALVLLAEEEGRGVLVEVALLPQLLEDLLHRLPMIVRGGASKEIVADAQPVPGLQELLVVTSGNVRRRDALLLRAHCDRRAMLVAAGEHDHLDSPPFDGSGQRCPRAGSSPPHAPSAGAR